MCVGGGAGSHLPLVSGEIPCFEGINREFRNFPSHKAWNSSHDNREKYLPKQRNPLQKAANG